MVKFAPSKQVPVVLVVPVVASVEGDIFELVFRTHVQAPFRGHILHHQPVIQEHHVSVPVKGDHLVSQPLIDTNRAVLHYGETSLITDMAIITTTEVTLVPMATHVKI